MSHWNETEWNKNPKKSRTTELENMQKDICRDTSHSNIFNVNQIEPIQMKEGNTKKKSGKEY